MDLIKIINEEIGNYVTFDLIQANPNIILNIFDASLTLYDTTYLNTKNPTKGVLGCIGLNEYDRFFEVARIAGKKGFGKIMYLLGMEFSNPLPMMIDREGDVREAAANVIEKINSTPPSNVRLEKVNPDDEDYIECLDWGCEEDEPDFFNALNTKFYSNNKINIDFFKNSNRLQSNELIDDYGRDFFDQVYD
jgi:hypothetical protein